MDRTLPMLVLTAVVAFTLGLVTQSQIARAATPTTDQLLSQIQALQTKVATVEGTALTTRATATTTGSALAALQARVDAMAQVLQVTPGKVLLKTPGDISVEAGGGLLLKAMGDTSLVAGVKMSATAGSTVTITGVGTTTVSGSYVKLNGGSKPVSHDGGTSATVQVP